MAILDNTKSIGVRPQNGGDYAIPSLTREDGPESVGQTWLCLHIKNENVSISVEVVRTAHDEQSFK
jgi:hypothetical protein